MTFFLTVVEDDVSTRYPLYSTTSDWSTGVINNEDATEIRLIGVQQLRLLTLDKSDYYRMSLFGKQISYDILLGNVKYAWNFAVYTCDWSTIRPPSYLDAQSLFNSVNENDLQEANRVAFHFTLHKAWDRGGNAIGLGGGLQNDPSRAFVSEAAPDVPPTQRFGPGQYIDTLQFITVVISFENDRVLVSLQQGDREIHQSLSGDYYQTLKSKLNESCHVLILSLWNSWSMDWLSSGMGSYDESGISTVDATLRNVRITSICSKE